MSYLDLKQERERRTPTEWVRTLPPYDRLNGEGMWVLGTYSYTNATQHRRIADKTDTIYIHPFTFTPSELARDYLSARYGKARRICKEQWRLFRTRPPSAPLLCIPGIYEGYQYVDLKAAYWTILNLVGWDVDYMPERWLSYGEPPYDYPAPDHKASRSALVSASRRNNVLVKVDERIFERPVFNPLWNDSLWYAVMHTLHLVARRAETLGAVYIHTDGYIMPSENVSALAAFAQAHGLTLGRKTPPSSAHICSIQAWAVGDLKTKRYTPTAWLSPLDSLIRDIDFTTLSRSLRYRATHPLT